VDEHERADWEARGKPALQEFAVRSRTVARQSEVDAAAVTALDALNAAGVDALLLKGVALARTLYRSDEHRGYYDVDLLVAPVDLAAAGGALAGLGYTNVSESRGIDDLAGILHAEVWSRLVPDFGNLLIDLHWRLDGCEAAPEIAWNALRARRAFIELDGHRVPTLDHSGLALHLALHTAQHGSADLKAVGDLNRGLERWSPEIWKQAAQLAHELRATEAFAAGLRLVPVGAVLARELRLPAADALLWAIAHRDTRPRGSFHLQTLTEARGLRGRAKVLRRSLLPTRAWIIWEHRWAARGGPQLLAAYGLHILRSPAWAAKAWLYRRRAQRRMD
jgi:hypothetical protein